MAEAEPVHGGARIPKGILSPQEQVILAMNPSRRYYYIRTGLGCLLLFLLAAVGPIVVMQLLCGPFPGLRPKMGGLWWVPPMLLGLVLAVLWWLPTISRVFSIYVLTDQRLIKRTGILATQTRYTPLAKVL